MFLRLVEWQIAARAVSYDVEFRKYLYPLADTKPDL